MSQSILRQAGPEMQWELDKAKQSSDSQTVLVTKGFKLSCQYVYHVVWQHDNKYQVSSKSVYVCIIAESRQFVKFPLFYYVCKLLSDDISLLGSTPMTD